MSVNEKMTAIANAIRNKTGKTGALSLDDMADKIPEVYNKGYADGKAQGGDGDSYDEYWDIMQINGNRINYDGGFAHWVEKYFKPKYDMKPSSACYIFSRFNKDIKEIDMVEHLKKYNVTLDFSACTNFTNFLMYSFVSRLGTVDTRAASAVNFYIAYRLKTIDSLILKDDGTQTFNFVMCSYLENITITGIIGQNINLGDCPLLKDSIISVINALSTTTSKKTVTFKKTAINNAFGINIDDESTYPEGSEFYNLRNSKTNWTFNYV